MIVAISLFLVTLALRSAAVSRRVRGKLLTSIILFAAYAAADALAVYGRLAPGVVDQIRTVNPLLLTFGIVNAIVVLAINPWRHDHAPERFPTIVQDAIVIALFALAAILFMQEKLLATTAVGAVVLGFALQDTLGNLFAGLAIQIEKPFRVGHWVTIGGTDGSVCEVTWRATKLRTKQGNFVIVPNSTVSKETITNYSEPTRDTRIDVQVGASYDTPPNDVKAVILGALRDEPLISRDHAPEVLLTDFAASAVTYTIRVWIQDFGTDMQVRDRVRSRIYYAFRRSDITIPYPIQVQQDMPAPERPPRIEASPAEVLGTIEFFGALSNAQREELARASHAALYAAGEAIVREGESGDSLFVILRGDAAVTLTGTDGEVARHHDGAVFGEMSLLTGQPRTATVTALTDCHLLEIDVDGFRRVALADPALLDTLTSAVVARRAELELHRTTHGSAEAAPEPPHTLLARVRHFLKLSLT